MIRKIIVKILRCNFFREIKHPVNTLMQVIFTIHIMKYFTRSNAIANGQNCFFIKQVSIAMLNYRRTNIERVNAIINTVLSIAFSCRNRAEVFCLPLFPSVCILWHKPQIFVETLAICVIIEITTYAFPEKGYFLKQKELDR